MSGRAKTDRAGAAATATGSGNVVSGKPTASPYTHDAALGQHDRSDAPATGIVWEVEHGSQLIRFTVATYKSRTYAELRRFYTADGEWRHGRQGCTMPLEALPGLHAAIGSYLAAHVPSEALSG